MSLNPSQKDNTLALNRALVQNNPVYMFACTKAERLVTALHLMTRHISEKEILRSSLREESVSLLRLLRVHDERVSEDALGERIGLLQSLLDAAFHSGLISGINHAVVRKEYEALERFLRERGGVFASTEAVVGDAFFAVPEPEPASEVALKKPTTQTTTQVQTPKAPIVKDINQSKGQRTTPSAPKKKSPKVAMKQSNRRSMIMDLLKRQENVSVRDVAEVVTGVSEKTIQRELLSLVEEGIVKKEGERRWSTYSLL